MNQPVKEILHHLERATASGSSNSNVFDDFLDLSLATIEALPGHVRKAAKGEPLTDTPETEKLFAGLRSRYPHPETWEHFTAAFGILIASADEWQDTIGDVYMNFNVSNKYTGQFFTPWNIAECMAQMTLPDVEKMLHDRMKDALRNDPLALSLLLTGTLISEPDEAQTWFEERILPIAAQHFDTIKVYDPCVGSGVMLLASAKQFPRWALDWGLVQFYGMDLDLTCVKMSQLNCKLYGLNGFHMKCALELSDLELSAIPEPFSSAYNEARTATPERVVEIRQEIRPATAIQMSIFDLSLNVSDPQ